MLQKQLKQRNKMNNETQLLKKISLLTEYVEEERIKLSKMEDSEEKEWQELCLCGTEARIDDLKEEHVLLLKHELIPSSKEKALVSA
jgi:hypothetical protein